MQLILEIIKSAEPAVQQSKLSLIIIESKNSGAAKQAVIHVDFTGVVVRIRIPETS